MVCIVVLLSISTKLEFLDVFSKRIVGIVVSSMVDVWDMRVDVFVVVGVEVLKKVADSKSLDAEGIFEVGEVIVIPGELISVAFTKVEVVDFSVVVIHAISLQDLSPVGAPKHGFPLGPVAATAKKRLRVCVPNPHVLLHLLHGPKSDHIQSTVRV